MMNREDTIEAFACCTQIPPDCKNCPEKGPTGELGRDCKSDVKTSVYHWLVVQEPVEPIIIDTSNSKLYHNDMFKNHYCGNCGEFLHVVNRKDMFCSQCGRAVKWE